MAAIFAPQAIYLLKKISRYFTNFKLKNINSYKINHINYLSLFSLIFINIFFYRIAEHGTDRSAQILVLIFVITILESFDKRNPKQIDIFFPKPLIKCPNAQICREM